jgi:hypothetical protein
MPFDVNSLIREVFRQARIQHMPPPAVTRLVKILYLSDLEWRRVHGGDPLTDLKWTFLHFGPYAPELASVLGGAETEITEFQAGKYARRLVFTEDELAASSDLPEEVVATVKGLVKAWGDANINMLLDFVYFDTEPMENATRGGLLDFSNLRAPARTLKLQIDPRRMDELRDRIRARVKALGLSREGVRISTVDLEAERAWDEDIPTIGLPSGRVIGFTNG